MIHIKNKPKERLEIIAIDFERTLSGEIKPCFTFCFDIEGKKCCLLFDDIDGEPEEIRELVEKHKKGVKDQWKIYLFFGAAISQNLIFWGD